MEPNKSIRRGRSRCYTITLWFMSLALTNYSNLHPRRISPLPVIKKKTPPPPPPTPRITPFPSFKCCFFESEQINIDLTCPWQPKWLKLIPLRCCRSRSTQENCRAISLEDICHHQRRWTSESTHFFNIGRKKTCSFSCNKDQHAPCSAL